MSPKSKADPLAGFREAINEGSLYSLVWLDRGEGSPVEVDEVYPCRSCTIEITKVQRFQKKIDWEHNGEALPAGWFWRAEFATYRKAVRTHYLARRGGLTTDRKQAMAAEDDPDPGTLRVISEDERDPVVATQHAALGEMPEAAVPKHEVPDYLASREARQVYELDMAERRVAEGSAPLEERLTRLREMSRLRHVDITSDLAVIAQRIEKAERKVLERAAA